MAKTCLTMFSLGRSILNIPSREATTLVVRETASTDWPSSALTSADPETRELVERIRGTAGDHVPVNDGPSQPGLSDPKIPADRPSLAVLPFENMSGDTEQDYFADGITDYIITGLSKSRMFFVVARNSTFTYKRSNVDVRRVPRNLAFSRWLKVACGGPGIAYASPLSSSMQVQTNTCGQNATTASSKMFAVQDEISTNIVTSITPKYLWAEKQRT